MTLDEFVAALEAELATRHEDFSRKGLKRFAASVWWLAQDDPHPVRWVRVFLDEWEPARRRRENDRLAVATRARPEDLLIEELLPEEDRLAPLFEVLLGRASERKLRLIAMAGCRHIAHLLTDEWSRAALEVVERFADRIATREELDRMAERARVARDQLRTLWRARDSAWADALAVRNYDAARAAARSQIQAHYLASEAVWWAAGAGSTDRVQEVMECLGCCSRALQSATAAERDPLYGICGEEGAATARFAGAAEQRYQARVVRDVLGTNPWGPPPADPSWLAWQGRMIPRLAQAIYDERRFEDMPVLADALEEAGCTDRRILAHCRQEEEHVRGCWVLDLLLKRT